VATTDQTPDRPGVRLHGPSPDFVPAAPGDLPGRIRDAALALGFVRVGFSPVERFDGDERALAAWLAEGLQGEMAYLAGESRANPRDLLAEARTVIVVALPYVPPPAASTERRLLGTIAGYATGGDYHAVIKQKLRKLADACAKLSGRPVLARPCVDTAPLLERAAAVRAGIGFAAKSTMTIVPGVGSYVLLGELLVDFELEPGRPQAPRCGSCRACLDACPTGAFVDEYVLDARRCIAYLTIELRGPIPRELRALIGSRIFGCDVCQQVCPFNASPSPRPAAPELAPREPAGRADLVQLLEIRSKAYRRWVKNSALGRVSRTRMARNAAVALGNSGDARAVDPLARALVADARPLVRGHAAWALGRLGGEAALAALERAAELEADAWVREEIELARKAAASVRES
jgi:epoxyqueuosine reductase